VAVCAARRLAGLLIVASLAGSPACAVAVSPRPDASRAARESVTTALLHGKRIDLHVALPATPARRDILVLYASGDGGWFGTAVEMWRQIARAGYATAGFSSRAFLRIDRPAGSMLNPTQLARDYQVVADKARVTLGLSADTRVILAGWSRGAAFSVLVGTDPEFRDKLDGVVAIGLAEGEDLTIDGDGDDTDDGAAASGGRRWPLDTYARVSQLARPCAVIQATHDNYFAAADARRRFGPDTPVRRFYQVEAKNHRFSGGQSAFDAALLDALQWISSNPALDAGERPPVAVAGPGGGP
jgi:hypothetical protein